MGNIIAPFFFEIVLPMSHDRLFHFCRVLHFLGRHFFLVPLLSSASIWFLWEGDISRHSSTFKCVFGSFTFKCVFGSFTFKCVFGPLLNVFLVVTSVDIAPLLNVFLVVLFFLTCFYSPPPFLVLFVFLK